jgi:hypothetical protein
MRLTNTALPTTSRGTSGPVVAGRGGRAEARAADEIEKRLLSKDLKVVRASSLFDAETAVASDAGFSCMVLSWGLCAKDLAHGLRVIDLIRRRTSGLPILPAMTREDAAACRLRSREHGRLTWLPEDSPTLSPVESKAARRYLRQHSPAFSARS